MNAVDVKDLSFAYQEFPVLKNVSFQVKEKEFSGIIGPNGGGKTTLLKLIMGLLHPSKGSVKVFGKNPIDVLPKIAYVPQVVRYDRQFPISVLEVVLQGRLSNLSWYGVFSEHDVELALKSLEIMGVKNLYKQSFGTLSGGQAQRVLIARALASEPELLLLDEPTANVDSQTQMEIYSMLTKLKEKMTILMVTHDLTAAVEYVEKVICVQNTVMVLKPQEVCEHFALGLYHAPLINGNK